MGRPKIGILFGELAVTSATATGNNEVFSKPVSGGKSVSAFKNNNVMPWGLRVKGFSKHIFLPTDVPIDDLNTVNKDFVVSIQANEDNYLIEEFPLAHIPEYCAPAGGVQESVAVAADGYNMAVVDGGKMFGLDQEDEWVLSQEDKIYCNIQCVAAPSGITASKTWTVRMLLLGSVI